MGRKYTRNSAFVLQIGFCHKLKKVSNCSDTKILGFVIDSVKMIVTFTKEKKQKLKPLVLNLVRINKPTTRCLTKVIGTFISCIIAAILGPLFYPYLEKDKLTSLRLNKGNFDALAKSSPEVHQELEWWLENTDNTEKSIALPSIDLEYFCHSPSYSWGAQTQGMWCLEYERKSSLF